jgi:hypothetical protein
LIADAVARTAPVEFLVRHPDDHRQVARYGFDATCGYYASVMWHDVLVMVDAGVQGFDTDEPVVAVLTFLSQFGYFGADDIRYALAWLHGEDAPPGWPGRRRRAPRRLRRVLRLIRNLERAGG